MSLRSRISLVVAVLCVHAAGLLNGAEPQGRPLVVGHRGLLHAAPENTLAGFRACLALRVGFEFDVRRTKDKELVSLHDDSVDRTTNKMGRLAGFSLDELSRLDAVKFDPVFAGERIPQIDEVFALLAASKDGGILAAVDLKETGDGIEEATVRLAQEHNVLDRLMFIGATIESPDVRKRLRSASREARTARLVPTADKIGEAIADPLVDWIYVRFLPSPDDVARIHKAGKRIFLAGPLVAGHEKENWAKAAGLNIDAILTDYPLELRSHAKSVKAAP